MLEQLVANVTGDNKITWMNMPVDRSEIQNSILNKIKSQDTIRNVYLMACRAKYKSQRNERNRFKWHTEPHGLAHHGIIVVAIICHSETRRQCSTLLYDRYKVGDLPWAAASHVTHHNLRTCIITQA